MEPLYIHSDTLSERDLSQKINQFENFLSRAGHSEGLLVLAYTFCEFWNVDRLIKLIAVYLFIKENSGYHIHYIVSEKSLLAKLRKFLSSTGKSPSFYEIFHSLQDSFKLPAFSNTGIFRLKPAEISKAWGRELWYTGMESRGIAGAVASAASSSLNEFYVGALNDLCAVGFTNSENTVLLPWVLSAMPQGMLGVEMTRMVLLKILDTLPDESFGDLYYEIHEEKEELYFVSGINREAWPEGIGEICIGFEKNRARQHKDEARLVSSFKNCIHAYREVREAIDTILDSRRSEEGIAQDKALPPEKLKTWLASIPRGLLGREQALRAEMKSYMGVLKVKRGDAIRIAPLIPHSLRHGVRVAEVQTPFYERLIISFNQKVLTQKGWNTDEAFEKMQKVYAGEGELRLFSSEEDGEGIPYPAEGITIGLYSVQRLSLEAGNSHSYSKISRYELILVLEGCLTLSLSSGASLRLGAEECAFLPKSLSRLDIRADEKKPCCYLLVGPDGWKTTAVSEP